jgi:hypothetical protein
MSELGSKTPPVKIIGAVVGLAILGGLSYFAYGTFIAGDDEPSAAPTEEVAPIEDVLEIPAELTELQLAALDRGTADEDGTVIADRVGALNFNDVKPAAITAGFVQTALSFCAGDVDTIGATDVPQLDNPDELVLIEHPDAQGRWLVHHQTRYEGTPQFVTCVETSPETIVRGACYMGDSEINGIDPVKEIPIHQIRWNALSYDSTTSEPVHQMTHRDVAAPDVGCPTNLLLPAEGNQLFPGKAYEFDDESIDPGSLTFRDESINFFSKIYQAMPAAYARTNSELTGDNSPAAMVVEKSDLPAGGKFLEKEAIFLCETGVAPKTEYMGFNTRGGDFAVYGTEIENFDDPSVPDEISCVTTSRGAQINTCAYLVDPLTENWLEEPIFALDWTAKIYDRRTGAAKSASGTVNSGPTRVCDGRYVAGSVVDSIRPEAVDGGDGYVTIPFGPVETIEELLAREGVQVNVDDLNPEWANPHDELDKAKQFVGRSLLASMFQSLGNGLYLGEGTGGDPRPDGFQPLTGTTPPPAETEEP